MKKYQIVAVLALAVSAFTTSCRTKKVTVGVENARFQHGYLNSKLLKPGTLLMWDMEAVEDKKLTPSTSPDISNNQTERHAGGTELVSKAASGLSVAGEIPIQQIPVTAKAEVARQTSIIVKQFESRRFNDPEFVLNEKDFALQRTQLGDGYAGDPNIRFIFIAGATHADDVNISIGTPTGKENVFTLTIAGKEYKLTYSGTKSHEWRGKQEPVFVHPRVYKLVKDSTGGTGYRFIEDRRIEVKNMTEMLTNASTF